MLHVILMLTWSSSFSDKFSVFGSTLDKICINSSIFWASLKTWVSYSSSTGRLEEDSWILST